jgi:hypothetical protein
MRFAALLAAVILVACESSPTSTRELLSLLGAKSEWEQRGLGNYDFVFTAGCGLCDPNPLRIEVRDGGVVRAISQISGDTTGPGASTPTVDSLYAWILRDRKAEHCGRQRVEVDPKHHYPRRMTCSGVPHIADSGHWWTVSGFQLVPTTELLTPNAAH